MSETGWFGKMGTARLARQQQTSAGGITAVTRTMIAAYKQFDDVEQLLTVIAHLEEHVPEKDRVDALFTYMPKIRERHEKYRAAQTQEVLPMTS